MPQRAAIPCRNVTVDADIPVANVKQTEAFMYPVARMFWQLGKAKKTPKLGLTETYVSQHHCLPWDLDVWR